ncbi:hypothetical protein BH23CHL8_BH23CHL8_30460 [soil metagenome]
MSVRPRLGGEGLLRLPAWVTVSRDGTVKGVSSGRAAGPFDRTADGLLLAETFARFDFSRPRLARAWFVEHGVVDLVSLFPHLRGPHHHPERMEVFVEPMADVLEQQQNVRWHLQALARLSTERGRAGAPDKPPPSTWDPAWARVAVRVPDGRVLWLGAQMTAEARITPDMQVHARYEDIPDRKPLSRYTLVGESPEWFTDVWWPAAHSAWQGIKRERIPVLWVPDDALYAAWPFDEATLNRPSGHATGGLAGTDWHGLMEIERRLLRPYVRRAAAREVEIVRRLSHRPTSEDDPRGDRWFGSIVIEQDPWWRSLLAPVYLQLLESLRRISEGRSGAAFCKECGQPFLILDARRSTFCTERERHRWSQRERRKRLAAPPAPLGMAR